MDLIAEVRKLNLPPGRYVVVGSAIMHQLGLREANDVDLAVTPELFETLRASGEWKEEARHGRTFLKKEPVEVIPRLDWEDYPTTAEEAIASATIIDGVAFMNLHELIKFKRALGREKDLRDISLIDAYLAQNSPGDAPSP